MKNLLGNLILLTISLSIVFIIGEVVSRYTTPLSPGPKIVDLDGKNLKISYVKAGEKFRIITPDFDALTTITKDGYRAPEANGQPEVLFVGDSFTYAQGVRDDETFSALYCKARGISCANLGVPGASTLYEVSRLEHYLKTKNWSPKMVHFFFFTGNDFGDNIEAAALRDKGLPFGPAELNLKDRIIEKKGLIKRTFDIGLKHSNLLRIAYYKILPMVRNSEEEKEKSLNESLAITKVEFAKLEALSKKYEFKYKLYVLYPAPEITHNLYQEIDAKLQALTTKPIISLAGLFKKDTANYFFPSDGHFNVDGNKKMANYLLKNELE